MSDSFLDAASSRAQEAVQTPEPPIDLTAMIASSTEHIDKPDLDERAYRYLKLNNELQVMLVSDPNCDHGAACCEVGVGSASDPEELPGLAHFLEHMLFLGTEKYPAEDAYQGYLEQHGGSSNAFTSHENTTYFFDVQHPFLRGALDRFAQFFLCPLFTESATGREMKAVDSENSKNQQSDAWRLQQLNKWAADPRHPWSKFNVGSLDTLTDKPEKRVRIDLRLTASSAGVLAASTVLCALVGAFFSSCNSVKFHAELLNYIDIPVVDIHGRQKQQKRTSTFFQFCAQTSGTLLCTDVAARGLDIPAVDWIIQFDPPDDPREYIHRVGRTARGAGAHGRALLFLIPEEAGFLKFLRSAKVRARFLSRSAAWPEKPLILLLRARSP